MVDQVVHDETSDLMRGLPLHERQTQQLFFDLLQFKSSLQPHLVETALPIRIRQLQERYLKGVQEAKRGTTFSFSSTSKLTTNDPELQTNQEEQHVHTRLSIDGSELAFTAAAESVTPWTVNASLLNIERIILRSDGSFSLRLKTPPMQAGFPVENVALKASSAYEATQWVLALTCGVNAFQQAQKNQPGASGNQQRNHLTQTSDLVWQGVRLRIFELALVMELHQAVQIVTERLLQDPVLQAHQDEIASLLFLIAPQ